MHQLPLPLPTADNLSIDMWVENCLRYHNDSAIIHAMSGMYKIESSLIVDAVASQFSDFMDTVGQRKMRVRMISIPVSITASQMIDESAFSIPDVKRHLQSFYSHGLIDRGNGGIVMLNRLISHSAIENTALSDLFAMSRAIFECAKQGRKRPPSLGDFGKAEGDSSWLYMPDGYYTMRHIIGVVFWEEGKAVPPIINGLGNIGDWQNSTVQSLLMDILRPETGDIEINILKPAALFDSILSATMSMLNRLAVTLVNESREQVNGVLAKVVMGCEQDTPGRNQVRMSIVAKQNPEQVVASATIRLSIMESMQAPIVLAGIKQAMEDQGVAVMSNEYFSGPITDSAAAGPVH